MSIAADADESAVKALAQQQPNVARFLEGVTVRKVILPVAAGRNLAVLVEAAVRKYILQLRGIDSTREFIDRHTNLLRDQEHAADSD